MAEFETRNVVLDQESVSIVDAVVEDRKLGKRGFSAALRSIILEWDMFIKSAHGESVAEGAGE